MDCLTQVTTAMVLRFHETDDKINAFFSTEATTLDDARVQEIGSGILSLCNLAASTAKRIVIDFRSIGWMSSAMIGELVLLNKAAKSQRLDVRLTNVAPNILEVLKITRLHKVFRIDDDDPGLTGIPST
ncbi:MAG TPA: STAS domain-containing protein [Pirellulaceae bacterium]|nr:STAS domain-containing protein [Pirellulaceae bacterium]